MKSCIAVLIMVSCLVMTESIEWKAEDVINLFTLMKQYGKEELDKLNEQLEKNKSHPVSQYLVATVLSEKEIKYIKDVNVLPESVKQNNNRIKVIFNDKNYENVPHKTKKPLHGEVLLLLEHQDIPRMTKTLREYHQDKNTFPFVVLYSHYIPCSDVKGVGYSCAEELANDAIVNHGEYKNLMLVGYKDIFHGTSKDKSIKFMQMGGIDLFKFEENALISVEFGVDLHSPGNEIRIFQDLFYSCLDIAPVSEKCCTVEISDQSEKKKILSMYVNTVVHFCTTNELKGIKGQFTKLSREAMIKCIEMYADSHTGNNCPNCTSTSTKYTVKVCGTFASTFGTKVGSPENPNEPYSPKWKEGPVTWNTLYDGYNVNATVNRPAVYCLQKFNDIKTLCTKLISKPDQKYVKLLKEKAFDYNKILETQTTTIKD